MVMLSLLIFPSKPANPTKRLAASLPRLLSRLLNGSPEIVFMPAIESISDDCIRNPAFFEPMRARALPSLAAACCSSRETNGNRY